MTIHTAPMRLAAIVALGLAASACAKSYAPVEAGRPAAEVGFHKSYANPGLGQPAAQTYSLADDEFCDTVRTAASFHWSTSDLKALRVAPGRPVVVWANTAYPSGGTISIGGAASSAYLAPGGCTSAVRFTPAEGRRYDIRHNAPIGSAGCLLEITDRATGEPVAGAERVMLTACRQRAKG